MSKRRFAPFLFVLVAVLATSLIAPPTANAQYFGQNKVQWEQFNFRVMKTPHFDIYYYGELTPSVGDVGRMAERWYTRLSTVFHHQLSERKPIVLYADHPDFAQTTTTGGLISAGVGGFTDPYRNRVVMPLTGLYADTDHVLGHELVHVFQFDISEESNKPGHKRMRIEALPLFMIEGMAEYLSQGRVDPQTAMWVRDALLEDKMPDLDKLERDPRISPYQFGQAFWAYVGGRWGDATVPAMFEDAAREGVEKSFKSVLGVSTKEFFKQWKESVAEDYQPILDSRKDTRNDLGKPLIGSSDPLRDLNVAPSLSPDGKLVAYLSTRNLFSVDLWLADADTGKVIRKIVSSEGDPHFDSLRFIDSAGTWSPDGHKLAIVVVSHGTNRLALVDVDSGKITRYIDVKGVGAMSTPAWSPDGRQIAVSGSVGGLTDLYLVDVASGKTDRLTSDPYGDIQPAWSPDGKTIAWATERGAATDLSTLRYSQLQIALYDLTTDHVKVLPLFEGARNSDPQFSPDGKSLWFIANPGGIADVFRYDFATGRVDRITKVTTGVTGITDTAPALSVAAKSGRVMFSLFEDRGWNLYRLDPKEELDQPVVTMSTSLSPDADLPPFQLTEASSIVSDYLSDPTKGLPPKDDFARSAYHPKLGLDYVGPPSIGLGTSPYGLGLGGTVAMTFSDILGRDQLGFAFEGGTSSSLGTLFGGEGYYLNRKHRINWGVVLTHIPYQSAYTSLYSDTRNVNGQVVPVTVYQQQIFTETDDEFSVVGQYPISITRRFEATAGYTHLGFDTKVESVAVDAGGNIVDDTIEHLPTIPNFGFAHAGVAFVGDSATWGFISPIRGTRYRAEIDTNEGDINFQTALIDYRHYWFHAPVTFAFRALHYGRYGTDAEDPRIVPLYIGYDTLIRGYDIGSISVSDCTTVGGSLQCPTYDRLIGSRMGIVNFEVRAPLFGPKGYGFFDVPFLPTEMVGFIDGGAAWTKEQSVKLEWATHSTDRIPVFSAGVAARILLGGVLPIQVYYAKPFQLPERSPVLGVTIAPGW